jgi:DNA-binding protein H-NS
MIRKLKAAAEEVRRRETEGVQQLRAVIEKYKLTRTHLTLVMKGMGARRGRADKTESKSAPKYRSPDNPAAVWSGHGRRPAWLIKALNDGKGIEEFLIRDAEEEPCNGSSTLN